METSFKVFNPLSMTRSLYILITETNPLILSICWTNIRVSFVWIKSLHISSFLSLAETSLQCWMDLAGFCSAGRIYLARSFLAPHSLSSNQLSNAATEPGATEPGNAERIVADTVLEPGATETGATDPEMAANIC